MSYHQVIAQVALRYNALAGAQMVDLEASYNTTPLTATQFKTTNFPFSAMKRSLRVTEGEIALAVANNKEHEWRPIIADQTTALASGASIPAVGASGAPILGVIGGVTDSSDNTPLTSDFTLAEIQALLNNPNGWRKINPYQFVINRPQIYHTVTTALVDVCVWDSDDADTAIAANGELLFPDAEGAYVSGLGSKMHNLDARFTSLSASFAEEYKAWLTAIAGGRTNP